MKTLEYTITFYSQWHCGSGTSAGADVDELVIKDKNHMPYVPGKTLKGLVREAVMNYVAYSGVADGLSGLVEATFGKEGETTGTAHFSNAKLNDQEYGAIVGAKAQGLLYEKITTTAIGTNGIAKDHSLRSMEVVVPCTLEASIGDVPDEMGEIIEKSLGLVKRLGQKRNRGYGRCDIKVKKGGKA